MTTGPLEANFSEILIQFSFKIIYLKMSSAKRQLLCSDFNVLKKPIAAVSNGILSILYNI